MNTRMRAIAAVIGLAALTVPASAQSTNDEPPSSARVRLGPLAVKPSVSITNLGIDTNVFNETSNPKRDVTATIEPQVETWLRLGPARFNSRSRSGIVYYQQYQGERSVNADHQAKLELWFNRVRPFVDASFLNSRLRPGYEIDTRAQRHEEGVQVGGKFRLAGETWLDLAAHRSRVDFDPDATFFGAPLREVLNRDVERVSATLRHPLTPYTSVVIFADTQRDRFELSPIRDSKSLRVLSGVEFDTRAVISGRAFLGYRRFDALGAGVPDHSGINASVDLAYALRESMRFSIRAERDVNYSMEILQPYYVVTALSGSISRVIVEPWELLATWGRQQLDYRDISAFDAAAGRVDHVQSYGAGLGYRLNGRMRVGFNVDYYRRESELEGRHYDTLRAGTSVTYGY